MQNKTDFIESLKPIAEDFAGDFDWDAIADEAGTFDATRSWHLRDDIAADIDDLGYSNDLNDIIASHDVSTTDEGDE